MMLVLELCLQWPPPYPQAQQQFPIYRLSNLLDQFHTVAENNIRVRNDFKDLTESSVIG